MAIAALRIVVKTLVCPEKSRSEPLFSPLDRKITRNTFRRKPPPTATSPERPLPSIVGETGGFRYRHFQREFGSKLGRWKFFTACTRSRRRYGRVRGAWTRSCSRASVQRSEEHT